jgi:hypothetical protein
MLRDKIRVHVSFFDENRNLRFSQDALMAVVGAGSRELMMRPLKLSANKEVDPMNSNFNHRLFYKDINAYRHFELRNNNQDGIRYVSDPASTPTMGIRNALFCALVHDQEGIELRYDNGPVLLFINGKNYGMMNMGEKRDNSGISGNNPKVNSEDIDLITVRDDMGFRVGRDKVGEGVVSIRNDGKVVYKGYFMDGALEYENISESARRSGSTAAIDDFLTIDPTDSGKMDPKSLIASMAAEAIACNTDFGMNNMSFWRSSPVGKSPEPFHALLFDFDQTFGLTEGEGDEGHDIMLDYEEKTKLFSQFLKKEEYKIAFIRKIDEFLNGPFRPENAIPIIDKLEKKMDPWIEYHLNMWTKGQMDKKRWKDNVQRIRKYVLARPEHVRKHLQDHFGFSGYSNMEFLVSPEKQGIIYMDTGVFNTPLEGKGTYANIPMKIFAKASIGHKFSHFLINGNNKISEQDYTLNPEDGMKVEAVFTEDSI